MKYTIKLLIVALYSLSLFGGFDFAYAENKEISVVLIVDSQSSISNVAATEIFSALENYKNINVTLKYAEEVRSFKESQIDYAISIGSASANEVVKLKPKFPVLFTFIPDDSIEELLNKHNKSHYYAITLYQPAKRNLLLSKLVLNRIAKIGLTLGPKTKKIINQYKAEARKASTDLVIKSSSNYSEPIDAMRDSLDESDLYIAIYDSEILNRHTSKWLLYMAYKMNKPVIGYSPAYTKAGAVASIYTTPEQFGTQSAEWLIDMLRNNKGNIIRSPKYFSISVNARIQHNLRLPDISAETLKSKIIEMEKGVSHD